MNYVSSVKALPTQDDLDTIREGVRAVVTRFDDDGVSLREFHCAMAESTRLGITMPEEYGGAGLGVTEAAVMMHEVASHGGMTSASTARSTWSRRRCPISGRATGASMRP